MKDNFSKEERNLLRARTPESYIDRSLKSNISSGRKAKITEYWIDKNDYTIDDIKYARNRHPYWKAKKMQGVAERNLIRSIEHNYGNGINIIWDNELIQEFIDCNRKDKKGNYENRDWELAEKFECSIPAIQHMRRKYNMAVRIIEAKLGRVTDKRLLDHIMLGEGTLRRMKL